MKKHLLFAVLLPALQVLHAQKPEGSFFIKAAQYGESVRTPEQLDSQKVLKVFKDGFWIAAHYIMPGRTFSGSGGGTFTIKDGKYIEKVTFFSWDNTAVGSTYAFDYKLTPTSYRQEGKINSRIAIQTIPLKKTSKK